MAASETCSRCGEEVRWGWRHGRESYWHRLDVEHEPVFGQPRTPEMEAADEAALDLPRTRWDEKKGEEIVYTTREFDRARMKKAAREALDAEEADDDEGSDEHEPIEVYATEMPLRGRIFVGFPDGPPAVAQVPGGARTLINLAAKQGWEVRRLSYARGPYVGSSGKSLGVSDSARLILVGPRVDGVATAAVAWWRDGKADTAWLLEGRKITQLGMKLLSTWMKEHPRA